MKKIVLAVMSTISGLVLLFSYRTSTNSDAAAPATTDPSGSGTEPTASASTTPNAGEASSSAAEPSASSSSWSGSSTAPGTYLGDAVETRWGTVQVQITVENGKIVSSGAIQYPNENHEDQKINSYAIPQLNAEVVEAQSARIDAISGATVTSAGYTTSLQSAIDQANLK
ncbi:MAG: FMN-binding protein [Propionibacteriaceae bacterium]|jgi:uncharacterized protein with FMN-binding domain|nr:FMN-binding protein [Propionibacteriaceae bacterium]